MEHEHDHVHEHERRSGESEKKCGCGHVHKHGENAGCEFGDPHKHHHSVGHDGECCCASCHTTEELFQETEEDARRAGEEFRREITFLAITGAIFFAAFAVEELHLFHDERTHTALHVLFAILYIVTGRPVLANAVRALRRGDIFNEFTLMGGATLAAFAIGETCETVGVMLFYRLGEAFQERAAANSRRSIKSLLARKPVTARVVKDGTAETADPRSLKKGDIVQVMPGEPIPADGRVVSGEATVETRTGGEAATERVCAGSRVRGGTLSLDGLLLVEADGPFSDDGAERLLEAARCAAERKAPTERFITKFAKWYTPAVFFISAAVMLVPPLAGRGEWHEWIYRGLVLLVVSCPCALVISIPLGYFGGIGAASKNGVLVKGADVFDALGRVRSAVFDKTGVLTYGNFKICEIIPYGGRSAGDVLAAAALAESGSTHPVGRAIAEAAGTGLAPEGAAITQIPGKGMIYRAGGDTIISGSKALLKEHGVETPVIGGGATVTYVAQNGLCIGAITADDELRPESAEAVAKLRELGMNGVYMLTGDRAEAAESAARALSLDGWRAGLRPGEKAAALAELCGGAEKALYVGDGIARGPVIAATEEGLEAGGFGQQASAETADAVILGGSPAKAAVLVRIARKTRAIVWENVALALGVKGVFLLLGASGHAGLWEAAFADVGVALMAILNSTRAARLK